MKSGIHPEYKKITVKCTCGNSFETRSTLGEDSLSVDVCSNCHPFYTGKQKIVDTAGRVEDFNRRFGGSLGTSKAVVSASNDASVANAASSQLVGGVSGNSASVGSKPASNKPASGVSHKPTGASIKLPANASNKPASAGGGGKPASNKPANVSSKPASASNKSSAAGSKSTKGGK